MQKTWMYHPRVSLQYRVGILHFLRYAYADANDEVKKPCPCCKCINSSNHVRATMYEHLTINGMLPDYRIWDFHGEKSMGQSHNNMSSGLQTSSKPVSEKTNHEHVVKTYLEMDCYNAYFSCGLKNYSGCTTNTFQKSVLLFCGNKKLGRKVKVKTSINSFNEEWRIWGSHILLDLNEIAISSFFVPICYCW